jgi:anti-anti-sigma regulatory factor
MLDDAFVTVSEYESGTVFAFQAQRIDGDRLGDLIEEVLLRSSRPGNKGVILDMRRLAIIRSTDIGAFFDILRRLRKKGQRLLLAGMNPNIRESFRAIRADELIEAYDRVEEAVQTL